MSDGQKIVLRKSATITNRITILEKCDIRLCAAFASQRRKRDKEGICSYWSMLTPTMQYSLYNGDPPDWRQDRHSIDAVQDMHPFVSSVAGET